MPTSYPRDRDRPWRLTQEDQSTHDDAAGAYLDLVYALTWGHVRSRTIREVALDACYRHAKDLLPVGEHAGLRLEARNEVTTHRNQVKDIDRKNNPRDSADPPDRENRALAAVDALIRATFTDFRFDLDQVELDATLSRTVGLGEPTRVTIALAHSEKEAQRAVLRHIGPLASFAERAHVAAKPRDVLRAFGDIAQTAALRQNADGDSQPAQLVQAILSHQIRRSREGGEGYFITTLRTNPDVYGTEGIAVVTENGCPILYVHPAAIAGRLQPMAFRAKSGAELAKLLRRAPGIVSGAKDGTKYRADIARAFGTRRLYAVNLTAFEAALENSGIVLSPDDDGRDPAPLAVDDVPEDDEERTRFMLTPVPGGMEETG